MPAKPPRKPSTPEYRERLAQYERLVATNPEVERKGDTMPYTSVNGHMFSLLTQDGTLALRLPAAERDAFLDRFRTRLTVQYGRVMSEYVDVPDELLADTKTLKRFFDASYEYVSSLRAKPTAKSKRRLPKKRR